MTSTAPSRPVRNRQVSSHVANDDNSVGLSAAAQNLLFAKPIIDLVKKIAKCTLFLPETVPLAIEEDDIPRRIFELEVEDGTVASTFNRRVDILFGEHDRDSDGRLKYVRRGNLGMDCVVKYLESIHWESAKIPFDLAEGKLARIADELDYLWCVISYLLSSQFSHEIVVVTGNLRNRQGRSRIQGHHLLRTLDTRKRWTCPSRHPPPPPPRRNPS
ncbi:hypothetical protein B0H14DRAFT_3854189 [Mycena olivaceomarginata]|nr:hypothetical protein B0H14DRAFT_3854189 [Mycena olivaceomarginata]